MLHGVVKTSAFAQGINKPCRKDVAGACGILRDCRRRRHLQAFCLKSDNHRSRTLRNNTCAQARCT
jgi:hypothetical protein